MWFLYTIYYKATTHLPGKISIKLIKEKRKKIYCYIERNLICKSMLFVEECLPGWNCCKLINMQYSLCWTACICKSFVTLVTIFCTCLQGKSFTSLEAKSFTNLQDKKCCGSVLWWNWSFMLAIGMVLDVSTGSWGVQKLLCLSLMV